MGSMGLQRVRHNWVTNKQITSRAGGKSADSGLFHRWHHQKLLKDGLWAVREKRGIKSDSIASGQSEEWSCQSTEIGRGLPRWHSDEESTCQCRICKRCRFDPEVAKNPWSRKWQPTPIFLLGKFHGQRSLTGYSPWGCKESDTTEPSTTTTTETGRFQISKYRGKNKVQRWVSGVWNVYYTSEKRWTSRSKVQDRSGLRVPIWTSSTYWWHLNPLIPVTLVCSLYFHMPFSFPPASALLMPSLIYKTLLPPPNLSTSVWIELKSHPFPQSFHQQTKTHSSPSLNPSQVTVYFSH